MCNYEIIYSFLLSSNHTAVPSSDSRLYETGVAFRCFGRGGGFGFVGGVFPRESGCDVDDLGGGGGGGFFCGTSQALTRIF